MQHFTILSSDADPSQDAERPSTVERIRRSLPFSDHITAERWGTSEDGRVLYFWASNEPYAIPPEATAQHTIVLATGDVDRSVRLSDLGVVPDLHRHISRMTGRFSAAVVNLRNGDWAVATTLARLDPVYYQAGPGRGMVSTWSSTLASVAERRAYETSGLASFLSAGHFYSDATFFAGIEAMPPFATLVWSSGSLSGRCDFFDHVLAGTAPSEAFYDDAAEALVRACRRVNSDEVPTISLSGGKDSRLLLAGLISAGVDVEAVTTSGGSANSADVYCAQLVAQAAGVRHRILALSSERARAQRHEAIDLQRRTLDVLRATDAQIISWGNLALRPKNNGRVVLNGLGGELLRGGYGKTSSDTRPGRTASEFLLSRGLRSEDLLSEPARSGYHEYIADWLGNFDRGISVTEAADWGYLYFRLGRWAAAQSRAGALSRRPTYPFLDNAFLAHVYGVPVSARTDDRLLHGLMARLSPELATLPFANDAWRFDPATKNDDLRARHPSAFVARGSGTEPNADWRQNWTHLLPELRRQICSAQARVALDGLVDWRRLEILLDGNGLHHGHRFYLFAVYAAAIVLTGALDRGPLEEGLVIDVPL